MTCLEDTAQTDSETHTMRATTLHYFTTKMMPALLLQQYIFIWLPRNNYFFLRYHPSTNAQLLAVVFCFLFFFCVFYLCLQWQKSTGEIIIFTYSTATQMHSSSHRRKLKSVYHNLR